MRVLVCGSRDWEDLHIMQLLLNFFSPNDTLINGKARGADSLAAFVASEQGAKLEDYPADWATHGKAAGPIRNAKMLEEGEPELVIAFGRGKGTDDMVRRAWTAGLPVYRITKETRDE